MTVALPALGAGPRDLELLPLTFGQIERVRKGAGREQEPCGGAWKDWVGVPVTCEGSRGLLPARVVIPLSAEYSPRSKLLLSPPGGGGGDGGGCRIPALSPAASGRGGAEAGASERHAPPGSRRAPGRPARLARSRLSPLRSRGIVFPRPPPPPPPGLGHATFSRPRPPRPPPPRLLCLPLSASATPTSPERRSASGEGGGTRTGSCGAPRRRRSPGGVWRARRARLRRPGVRCAEPCAGGCAGLSECCAGPAWVWRLLRPHCCRDPTRPG